MIRPRGNYWISNWLKWRRETRSAKRHLATRVAFTSQLTINVWYLVLSIWTSLQGNPRTSEAGQALLLQVKWRHGHLLRSRQYHFYRTNYNGKFYWTSYHGQFYWTKATRNFHWTKAKRHFYRTRDHRNCNWSKTGEGLLGEMSHVSVFTFLIDSWLDTWWPFFFNWTVRY